VGEHLHKKSICLALIRALSFEKLTILTLNRKNGSNQAALAMEKTGVKALLNYLIMT